MQVFDTVRLLVLSRMEGEDSTRLSASRLSGLRSLLLLAGQAVATAIEVTKQMEWVGMVVVEEVVEM